MRWFSIGQEASGVIAIGQEATGVVAVGQVATGVIAIGQAARGFVAIGQGAIGVVAVGMGAVGLVYTVAMIGAGGRGIGLVLPLVPSLGPRVDRPKTEAPAVLFAKKEDGWAEAVLEETSLRVGGKSLDVRFDTRLRAAIEGRSTPTSVYAHIAPGPDGWVCDALTEVPTPRWKSPGWWGWWAVQLAGLGIAAAVFWGVAGIPVVQALFNPGGILVR